MNTKHQLGRACLVFGYSLVALGTVINVVYNLSQGYIGANNVRSILSDIAEPAGVIAGLCAWWFLSALVVSEGPQIALVRKAFAGLFVQAISLSAIYFIIVTSGIQLSWPGTGWWLTAIGQLGAGVGFLVIYFSYRSSAPHLEGRHPLESVPENELT